MLPTLSQLVVARVATAAYSVDSTVFFGVLQVI